MAPAQGLGLAVEDWTRTVTVLGAQQYGKMIARDASDAIYVAGNGLFDRIVTAKYAPDGTLLWQKAFAHPGTMEDATWITVDPFGDVIVVGNRVSPSATEPIGLVVLKYGPTGTLLWSDLVSAPVNQLSRVATDSNGDIVVVGVAPQLAATGGLVRKYSRNGAVLWDRSVPARPTGLAIDAGGRIFVGAGAAITIVTHAYDSAGNLLWAHTQPNAAGATDVALGPTGEVYVSGALLSATAVDRSLVCKFTPTGTLAWARSFPGTQARRIAVDSHGDVVLIAGLNPSGGYFDWQTRKITPAGNTVWFATSDRHRFNDELPNALSIGADDEIYVTGQGGPGPTSGTLSYTQQVTMRYARNGTLEWSGSSFTSSSGVGLVHLADNSIVTLGRSTFTLFRYLQRGVWWSLGGGLAGATSPRLEGTGSPTGGTAVSLELSQAAASAPTWIVAGFSRLDTPFAGGTVVPAPDIILTATTQANGTMSMPLVWPAGLPLGFEVTIQAWIADATGPMGFAASNALVAVSR